MNNYKYHLLLGLFLEDMLGYKHLSLYLAAVPGDKTLEHTYLDLY